MTSATRYRSDIDGLRSLAVVPVVLFHAGMQGVGGGFVGVDIFFVISGYLITGILLREIASGHYSIVAFYERRIRRIFPALFTMIAATLFVGWLLLLPMELVGLGRQMAATTLFVSNVLFWRESGYFDAASETQPLLHTWSLSVEEQFYIFFPIALAWIAKISRRWILPFILVVALVSFAASILLLGPAPEATFYSLPTRAWELAIGSMVAMAPAYSGRFRELLAAGGMLAIVAAITLYTSSTPFPGLAALLPCLGAALILYAANGTITGKVLSAKPLRGIGLISYSLYLWHWPVIVYSNFLFGRPLSLPISLFAILVSVVLAIVCWWMVERPLRQRASARTVWIIGASCIILCLLVSGVMIAAKGFPGRYSTRANAILQADQNEEDQLKAEYECPTLEFDGVDNFGPCAVGETSHAPTILIVGDSHAMASRTAFDQTLRAMHVSGALISVPGCPPIAMDRVESGYNCLRRNRRILEYVDHIKPTAIVLVASWRGALFEKDSIRDGERSFDDPSRLANVKSALIETVETYQNKAIKVAILLPVPGARVDVPNSMARGVYLQPELGSAEFREKMKLFYAAVASSHPDVVEDLAVPFCQGGRCAVSDGRPFYLDDNHLNDAGEARIIPTLRRTIERLTISDKCKREIPHTCSVE